MCLDVCLGVFVLLRFVYRFRFSIKWDVRVGGQALVQTSVK